VIEFLCPNNHKIRCTDDQAGRAAKCPKCGEKFVIPTNGSANKQSTDHVVSHSQSSNMADSHIALDTLETKLAGESSAAVLSPAKTASSLSKLSGMMSVMPSMARLFAKMWSEKPKDVVLEIILRNGDVYKPDVFSKKLSQQHQGVFGIKEMDGTYTVLIVAWDALSHVQLRKMRELPMEFNDK
jgi:hypothetical protein